MWIREKHNWGRWAAWEWVPELTEDYLRTLRGVVKVAFQECCKGEELVSHHKNIWVPFYFSPNAFICRVLEQAAPEIKITLFNIRYFMHTIQVASGTYESGPLEPYRRLPNVFEQKK